MLFQAITPCSIRGHRVVTISLGLFSFENASHDIQGLRYCPHTASPATRSSPQVPFRQCHCDQDSWSSASAENYVVFYGDFVLKSFEVASCRSSRICSFGSRIWMQHCAIRRSPKVAFGCPEKAPALYEPDELPGCSTLQQRRVQRVNRAAPCQWPFVTLR
jgi:hypothetical protein